MLILVSISSIWILYLILSLPLKAKESIDLLDRNYYIAHAGGGIDGYTYTNSKEALLQSLDRGYKFIELDFSMTSDGQLVCAHGASVFNKKTNGNKDSINIMPDLLSFKQKRIDGKYSPMTAEELVEIMNQRDFVLLVDCLSDPNIIDKHFSNFKSRILVETSSINNYVALHKEDYKVLYSMGNIGIKNIIGYLINTIMIGEPVSIITVSVDCNYSNLRILRRLFGVKAYAFTTNSIEYMRSHIGTDIDKVYTDNLY